MACLVGRDVRSTTAKNLRLLRRETGLDPWVDSSTTFKRALREKEDNLLVPATDEWRVSYLALLLEQRQAAHYEAMEEEEERLSSLIDSLCIN